MQICNSLIVLIQMVALIDAVHSSFIPEAHPNEKNLEEYLGDSVKRLESKTLQEKTLKGVKPDIEKTGDKKYVITPIPKKKKTMSEDDDLSDPYLVKCLKQESPIEEIEKDMGNPETVRAFLTCEDAKANKTKNMSSENIEEEKARLGVMPPEEIAPSESDMTVTEDGTSKVLIVRIEPEKKKTVDISDISVKTIEEKQTLRERGGLDNSDDTIKRLEQGVKSPDTDKVNEESIKNKNVFGDISLVEPEKKRPLKGPKEEKMISEDYDSSDPYLVKCLKQESPIVGTENGMGNPSTCEEVISVLEYTEMKKARNGVMPPEEIAPSNSDMTVTENGTSKVLITRIEPDNKKTVEISDISLKPLEEKKTSRKRDAVDDSRGNMPLKYTEEKKARDGVIPPEEIALSNSGMPVTENGTSKVLITRIEPDNKKTVEISDISLKPLEEKKTLRKRDAVDNSDDTVKRLEQGEPNNLLAKVLGIPISSTTETAVVEIANNTEMKPGLESERTVTNQQLLSNTTSSTLDKPTIEVFRMESTTINSKSGNNSDADSRVKIQGTNQLPTDSPKFQIQVDTTISTKEPGTFEERTQMEVTQTEKPTLFGRMKHNRHRKLHSEENEEDKPVGSVPCTCGVFLSGQFKKGSKQQPKGLPVLTQEMDNPFMNNAMGSRQCTNKCLELIIKHLPKSSEIICATVDRENVFKERAYLFIKNHSDKWHGTNLSAGREFCCRDNTPYKCPAS
nr:uncharacterized protein LOC111507136 isoform X2 [Leptinotarsa decemlineata]